LRPRDTSGKQSDAWLPTELVYFEEFERMEDAIQREKQLKAGSTEKKINLISGFNPKWEDQFKKRP
jgi:predicted GIY-YIG superfamily endonuclease